MWKILKSSMICRFAEELKEILIDLNKEILEAYLKMNRSKVNVYY